MIKKIKASKSEKIIFIFIIVLALFSFGSFFLIKDKCLFVKDYDPKKIKFDKPKNINTVFVIGALPLGGYVKIKGMLDENMDTEIKGADDELESKSALEKIWVLSA